MQRVKLSGRSTLEQQQVWTAVGRQVALHILQTVHHQPCRHGD
jgi:hypothetical protein